MNVPSNNNHAPERRVELVRWQAHVDRRLDSQDDTLRNIVIKLDSHIVDLGAVKKQVTPVVEAIDAMQGGIRVIGWIGSKVTAVAALIAAVVGAIVAWKNWK